MTLHISTLEPLMLTPQEAGWENAGLQVLWLEPGTPQSVNTGAAEVFVLPLSGATTVEVATVAGDQEASFELAGRESVFTQVTDFAYVGRDSVVTLTSPSGAEVALPSARCQTRRPPAYGAAADVPVEVPGAWDHAERLMCCELITPPGNWSSYPPHKHDTTDPCRVANEEIYYFRIAGADQVTPSREGFGLHRTYTGTEHAAAGLIELDDLFEVRDGDVVLVPYGYHGPCVAAPGYPMYYLNVLAGTGSERSMACCDDPVHAWIRDSWSGRPTDPRCPVTSATGRLGAT